MSYATIDERWDEPTCLAWVEDCLKWRGEVLHGNHCHWCLDWDGLPVDDTTDEWSCCLIQEGVKAGVIP